jgi:methanogenic corrinoid protein MtbC1
VDQANHDRLYTIGETVAALQAAFPDVSHSSLRFLEREGFIDPHRTQGGHRLYASGDLARIRLIKRWQAERLSLADIRQRLDRLDTLASPEQVADRFTALAVSGNGADASQTVLLCDELGMPLERIFDEVLRPSLVDIGERWAAGTLTVAQEHEVSELVRDLIAQLTLRHRPSHSDLPVVVAACVADELHELGLRMVSGLLRQRGARVHFLGANVASWFVVESTQRLDAAAVLLSVALEDHLPALEETLDALRQASFATRPPVVFVGGRATAGLERRLAGANVRVVADGELALVVDAVVSALGPAGPAGHR